MIKKISQATWFVKIVNWEFWNFYVVYFPYIIYYIWLSFKARSFFWFSTSNPGIENAGFIGESKNSIFEKIPSEYLPNYFKVLHSDLFQKVVPKTIENNISYPFIAKPDVGERGQGVSKIQNEIEWELYHLNAKTNYLVQSFVPFELELGVFYYRFPNQQRGVVSSIVKKDFLKVVGNGILTLGELIESYPRARFRKVFLKQKFSNEWNNIPNDGKIIELEGIGNHVRGTTFLDATNLITTQVSRKFDEISSQISGFYFGRFDIRCTNEQDFLMGKNIKILELNGAGAEPAHIYQPGFSFLKAQMVLLSHLSVLYKISMQNHQNGHPFMNWSVAKAELRKHSEAIRKLQET